MESAWEDGGGGGVTVVEARWQPEGDPNPALWTQNSSQTTLKRSPTQCQGLVYTDAMLYWLLHLARCAQDRRVKATWAPGKSEYFGWLPDTVDVHECFQFQALNLL